MAKGTQDSTGIYQGLLMASQLPQSPFTSTCDTFQSLCASLQANLVLSYIQPLSHLSYKSNFLLSQCLLSLILSVSVCLSDSVCVCVSVCLTLWVSLCVSVCMCVCVCVCGMCLCVCGGCVCIHGCGDWHK